MRSPVGTRPHISQRTDGGPDVVFDIAEKVASKVLEVVEETVTLHSGKECSSLNDSAKNRSRCAGPGRIYDFVCGVPEVAYGVVDGTFDRAEKAASILGVEETIALHGVKERSRLNGSGESRFWSDGSDGGVPDVGCGVLGVAYDAIEKVASVLGVEELATLHSVKERSHLDDSAKNRSRCAAPGRIYDFVCGVPEGAYGVVDGTSDRAEKAASVPGVEEAITLHGVKGRSRLDGSGNNRSQQGVKGGFGLIASGQCGNDVLRAEVQVVQEIPDLVSRQRGPRIACGNWGLREERGAARATGKLADIARLK